MITVPSKHKEASAFLRKGFFEGLKSFREFEARTETLNNTKEVGDAFEILVEAYLHLDPVLRAKEVWLVGNVPLSIRSRLNLPADSKGIDGVYADAAGCLIPYQAKYRTDKDTLSYTEVSAFLGVTEESLQDRVIFTNARGMAGDIINRKGLRSVRAAQFHDLGEEDFSRIHAWLCDRKKEPSRWEPKPHQSNAIEAISAELQHASRATAVMACGTGKTLVALWVAETVEPKTVLVLVPSLALLSQTLPEWCRQSKWGDRFRYLCVCSDASVDQSAQNDDYALMQSDLEFTVTTEAKRVQEFLAANSTGVNVIFSTYQSAEVVAAGLNGGAIDFGVFDEAHKTTGPKEGLFAFGLRDENILIKKRLFLTATPRHYDLRKRDKDGDFSTVSMSDEQVYGKVAYRLSFSAAVAAGIIVPYKVIISVSLNKEVDDELLRNGSTLVRRDQIQAKWVANQIALKRAIEKTSATKIITFHSRVNLAESFASEGTQGFSEHVKGFEVFHVNGSQSAADRKAALEWFKAAPKGLISNARCLTEGVDVPAVDMVAFIDPRKSKIDIAQAAGRAMRHSKATNKKLGYIVVPLFIEQKQNETEAEALARSGFEEVAMVLGAMLENDDDLEDIIREMQEAKGRGDPFNPNRLHDKIGVIGPSIDLDELERSIDVEIVERLGMGWDYWYGLLQRFKQREGHCRPAEKHKEEGLNLGVWVYTLRRASEHKLSAEKIQRLNQLGFCWDPYTEAWDAHFAALERFKQREGHCRVAHQHKEDGLNLGIWVGNQRWTLAKLPPEKIEQLNQLGFSWDLLNEAWESNFAVLERFKQREGHCRVAVNHQEEGLKLGGWVSKLRGDKNTLSPERIERLDQLGLRWDPLADAWDAHFAALERFKQREGHCRPARKHQEDGLNLGGWVGNQRWALAKLPPEKIEQLNQLGFSWDLLNEAWESNFAALERFTQREGHCRATKKHKIDGLKLGVWISTQRKTKATLSPERIERLNQLGFSWDPYAESWEANFAALERFKRREGHCSAAQKHQEDGLSLGAWLNTQRTGKEKLSPERIERLNQLGFSWDPHAENWEANFAALQRYRQREGHCRIAAAHQEGELNLGAWAKRVRAKKDTLSSEQIERLNQLGLSWDPYADDWEANFAALEHFKQREGHCRPSRDHHEDGLNLGGWVALRRARKNRLTPEQIERLNQLGFSWDPHAENWEANFAALEQFKQREGHCRFASGHQEDGLNLSNWIGMQRRSKNKLLPERIERLNQLGFRWDPRSEDRAANLEAT